MNPKRGQDRTGLNPLPSRGTIKLKDMRRFLYSKWFFLLLVIVCAIDLVADVGENIWGHNILNNVAIGMDFTALILAAWMFIDLHTRRPRRGDHTPH